jgi:hypothetical protein
MARVRDGCATLPLLALQFVLLVSLLAVGVAAGSSRDPAAPTAVVAGMLGVAAMAVQNALAQISLVGAPAIVGFTVGCSLGALLEVVIGPWSLALPTGFAVLARWRWVSRSRERPRLSDLRRHCPFSRIESVCARKAGTRATPSAVDPSFLFSRDDESMMQPDRHERRSVIDRHHHTFRRIGTHRANAKGWEGQTDYRMSTQNWAVANSPRSYNGCATHTTVRQARAPTPPARLNLCKGMGRTISIERL